MFTSLLLSVAALAGSPKVTWDAPSVYVDGNPFKASVEITLPEEGGSVPTWILTPSAFTLDGKPLSDLTTKEVVPMPAGTIISISMDLAPAIKSSKNYKGDGFKLGFRKEFSDAEAKAIDFAKGAPKGLNFMEMPVADLSKYQVIMDTNDGTMKFEFWPQAAPNHVRNFLDLSYTKFYDGLTFHRAMPGFMIQGGDPAGTGGGGSPRKVNAEFSRDDKYKHVRGVLSMARLGHDVNSASCQFFVMHGANSGLDGQYSAFGKCISGMEVVDRIVGTVPPGTETPTGKHYIKSAAVILVE